jgi:hypothetical protein
MFVLQAQVHMKAQKLMNKYAILEAAKKVLFVLIFNGHLGGEQAFIGS